MGEADLAGLDVAVVGLGAMGRALAGAIGRDGTRRTLQLHSRRAGELQDLERRLAITAGSPASVSDDLAEVLRDADLVVLCRRDDELEPLAREVARAGPARAGAVLLHTSGFHGAGVLARARGAGWAVGGLHPLQSVAAGRPLAPSVFGVSGDEPARARARRLARAAGGEPIEVADDAAGRARYHAAAALVGNGAVALFDAGLELLGTATRADHAVRRAALAALLASVASKLAGTDVEEALTGPVARAEREVVEGHLACLADRPELLELYRRLAWRLVAVARRAGRAEGGALDEIAALLARPKD